MSESSKTEAMNRSKLSSKSSSNFGKERLSQTAEGIMSLRDLRSRSKKEEASKPMYLIRYE